MSPAEQAAVQQFENQRTHIAGAAEFVASQPLFWEERTNKKRRSPTTPMQSEGGMPTGDHNAAPSGAAGPDDVLGPSLVQPVTVQDEAAIAFTAADQGVDINVAANLQAWLTTPVQTNRDVLRLIRSYRKQVIRPEYYNIAIQLETALKHIDDRVFHTKRELAWMSADNRSQQKHMAGLQLITTGWPAGVRPEQRLYLIGWMLQQIPAVATFLQAAFGPQRHPAIPECALYRAHNGAAGDFLLLHDGPLLQKLGHEAGLHPEVRRWLGNSPLPFRGPANERTPHKGGAELATIAAKTRIPNSSDSGSHEQHRGPQPRQQALRDLAEVFDDYGTNGPRRRFQGGCQSMGQDLLPEQRRRIRGAPRSGSRAESDSPQWPGERGCSGGDALGREVGQWGQVQWGPQRELDEADKVAFGTALQQSKGSGKGVSYKGNRHWSAPMVHSSYYAPFPFEFNIVEVDHIAFSWDEYCTKCGATQHVVGDVAVCTHQASPAL